MAKLVKTRVISTIKKPIAKTITTGHKIQTALKKNHSKINSQIGRGVSTAVKRADTTGSIAPLMTAAESGAKVFKVAQIGTNFSYNISDKVARKVFSKNLDKMKRLKLSAAQRSAVQTILRYVPAPITHTVNTAIISYKLAKGTITAMPKIPIKTKSGAMLTVGTVRKLVTGNYHVGYKIKTAVINRTNSAVKTARNIKTTVISVPGKIRQVGRTTQIKVLNNFSNMKMNVKTIPSKTVRMMMNVPHNISNGLKNVGKAVTNVQNIKNAGKAAGAATLKTAKVGGRVLTTGVVVGGGVGLKTAIIGNQGIGLIGNQLSKVDDATIRTMGEMLKTSSTSAKIAVQGTRATVKTAVGGAKLTVKTTKNTIRGIKNVRNMIKTDGLGKTSGKLGVGAIKNTGKFVVKGGAAFAKFTAELGRKVALKFVLPIVFIIVVVCGLSSAMVTPVMGVVGYIQESIGWIFKMFQKDSETDYDSLELPSTDLELYNNYISLIDEAKIILNNFTYKEDKINSLKGVYPSQIIVEDDDDNFRLKSEWNTYYPNYATINNSIATYEIQAELAALPTAPEGVSYSWASPKITYPSEYDWSPILEDFYLDDYKSFFITAYLNKFPNGITDDKTVQYKENELKGLLCDYDGYSTEYRTDTGKGFPALYDYIDMNVTKTLKSKSISSDPPAVIFWYEIKTTVIPRMNRADLNPRNAPNTYPPSTQASKDLFDRYDFSSEYLDYIISSATS